MKIRKAHFLKAIRGRQVTVCVEGSGAEVFISQKEALRLFDRLGGDIAWQINGGPIFLIANARENFGRTGNIDDERLEAGG